MTKQDDNKTKNVENNKLRVQAEAIGEHNTAYKKYKNCKRMHPFYFFAYLLVNSPHVWQFYCPHQLRILGQAHD